ncbi:MAG: hypothetical protein QHH02_09520, partial [Syntrophomonadaceae bacterium]|nr:hypothetical protein [Syntrophomonadaceae bacterium]
MPVINSLRHLLVIAGKALVTALRHTTTRHILLGLFFLLASTLLLATNINPQEVDLVPGQISPRDILAPRNATLVDEARTAELKKQAAAAVPKQYQQDPGALAAMQESVAKFYRRVLELHNDPGLNESQKIERLRYLVQTELNGNPKELEAFDDYSCRALLQADEPTLGQLSSHTSRIAENLMARTLKEEDLVLSREQARVEAWRLNIRDEYKKWVTLVLQSTLRPTMIVNQELTNQLIEKAVSQVLPVQRTVKQGQVLVRKGDPVSAEEIDMLRQLGIQRTRSFWLSLTGLALLVLVLMGVSLTFLRLYHPEVYHQEKMMILLGLLVLITLVLAKGFSAINFSNRPELSSTVGFLVPAAVGAMLMAILISPRIGIFGTIIIGIIIGVIIEPHNIAYSVVALASGLVGVYGVSRVSQGWDLAKSGLLIGGVNTLVIVALGLITYESSLPWILWGSLYGILNGLLSAVLTTGLLPYLEATFGITSAIRLLELASPNHP